MVLNAAMPLHVVLLSDGMSRCSAIHQCLPLHAFVQGIPILSEIIDVHFVTAPGSRP